MGHNEQSAARRLVALALGALSSTCSGRAVGEPLRLRADALADTKSPTGLVAVQGRDKLYPWLEAEAVVWGGARTDAAADVLILAFKLRDPQGRVELKAGRFVMSTGAIRPIQIDGLSLLGRAPTGTMIEAFGGAPVVPRFGARAYDWAAGGRLSQSVLTRATFGVSYLQRRHFGELSDDDLGADASVTPARWLDLAARSAYDLTSRGIADALLSAALRAEPLRVELFATQRSPSRLLPSTSLFSVLGDSPSQTVGTTVRWYAAPRLDVLATAAAQRIDDSLGGNAWLRSTLRLDDKGAGQLGLELRRQSVSAARWLGVRIIASQLVTSALRLSTELEVARPDQSYGGPRFWPWGLVALGFHSPVGWEIAGAIEGASTPQNRSELNALLRVSRSLEVR